MPYSLCSTAQYTYTSLSIYSSSLSLSPSVPSQSLWVLCLFIFLLISHLSQRRSPIYRARLCPLPSLFFKFPEHKGLSYFSINVTTSSLLFAAAASALLSFPIAASPSPLCHFSPSRQASYQCTVIQAQFHSHKIKHATSALSLCVLYKSTVVIIKQEHL